MTGPKKRRVKYICQVTVVFGMICVVIVTLTNQVYETEIGQSFHRRQQEQHYVCQTFNGKLGNHIFQYASVYGIARANNKSVILGQDDDLVKYFEVPSAVIRTSRKECQYFEKLLAKHCCAFDERLMILEKNKNYLLGEYLQSWKYFAHVNNDVRKELTLRRPYKEAAKNIVENYRQAYRAKTSRMPTIVGAHIRRGDLASQKFIEDDEVLLTPDEYIFRSIDYFLQHFKDVIFIVCSDGMQYAKKIMKYKNITVEFIHTTPIYDFAILSSCDHVVTTTGSFGWWAAYLSGGNVTYWNSPIREGTYSRAEYTYEDFFLPGWTGLNGTVKIRPEAHRQLRWKPYS